MLTIISADTRSARNVETARPRILGGPARCCRTWIASLAYGFADKLPRIADFAVWATACGTALWPAGSFVPTYEVNRRAAIERITEEDAVALCIRNLMAERTSWVGTAFDLLRAAPAFLGNDNAAVPGWPKHPGALAGRVRRAQTFLRSLGIEVLFSREGRAGTRTISISS